MFGLLPPKALAAACCVCRAWREAASDDALWAAHIVAFHPHRLGRPPLPALPLAEPQPPAAPEGSAKRGVAKEDTSQGAAARAQQLKGKARLGGDPPHAEPREAPPEPPPLGLRAAFAELERRRAAPSRPHCPSPPRNWQHM